MADVSDVQDVIATIAEATLYPNGTSDPVSPICNAQCRIYAGWPNSGLDDDLANSIINVSVFTVPELERNTTRYPRTQRRTAAPNVTLAWTVSGTSATLSGTVQTPQNLALIVSTQAGENVYAYSVQAGDTLDSICSTFAGLISGATAAGATITIPGAINVIGRAGGFSTLLKEVKRQERGFMVSFWCSTPEQRDLVAPPVDAALADLIFIDLPDGSRGRIRYVRTNVIDDTQNAALYRRDLVYTVEYPTTIITTAPQTIAWKLAIQGCAVAPPSPTDPAPITIIV